MQRIQQTCCSTGYTTISSGIPPLNYARNGENRHLQPTIEGSRSHRFFAQLYGVPNARDRIRNLAEDLDLTDLLDRRSGNLSSGQKTRVSLAKALINQPEVLLLDEPTASLDPDMADWMRGYLESYQARSGAAILLASHNMAEVERLCDQVLMMRAGRIVDRGAPSELIERHGRVDMEQVFLTIARQADGAPGATGQDGGSATP